MGPPTWDSTADELLVEIAGRHTHRSLTDSGQKSLYRVSWKNVSLEWTQLSRVPRTLESLRRRHNKLMISQSTVTHAPTVTHASALQHSLPTSGMLLPCVAAAERDGSLLAGGRAEEVEDMEIDEMDVDEAALGEVADELVTAQETTAEEAVQHNGATVAARHLGTGDERVARTGGAAAAGPSYAFVDAMQPDHAVYIFDNSYYHGVPERITDVLVRETWQLDEGAYGGCPDQRSIDGRALKGEAGSKSLCRGYAVQDGTRWMIAQHVGLATHQVLSFSELFDCKLMVHLWQTGNEGRPPVPEPRSGAQLFDKVCDLRNVSSS